MHNLNLLSISEKKSDEEILKADMKDLYDVFKDLVRVSYGVKTEDGKRIMKSEENYRSFLESPAYDKIMMSFFEEPQATIDFMAGLLPKEMGEEAMKTYNKEIKSVVGEEKNEEQTLDRPKNNR